MHKVKVEKNVRYAYDYALFNSITKIGFLLILFFSLKRAAKMLSTDVYYLYQIITCKDMRFFVSDSE